MITMSDKHILVSWRLISRLSMMKSHIAHAGNITCYRLLYSEQDPYLLEVSTLSYFILILSPIAAKDYLFSLPSFSLSSPLAVLRLRCWWSHLGLSLRHIAPNNVSTIISAISLCTQILAVIEARCQVQAAYHTLAKLTTQ